MCTELNSTYMLQLTAECMQDCCYTVVAAAAAAAYKDDGRDDDDDAGDAYRGVSRPLLAPGCHEHLYWPNHKFSSSLIFLLNCVP